MSEVAIHCCTIEGNHDDLAAMAVVAFFVFFGNVDDGESECGDVAVLNENAGVFAGWLHMTKTRRCSPAGMRATISGGNAIWPPCMIVPPNSIARIGGSTLHQGMSLGYCSLANLIAGVV